MKKISVEKLRAGLKTIAYHKIDLFITHCEVEEDNSEEFSSETIQQVAWSMLDRDLESKLLRKLGIQ